MFCRHTQCLEKKGEMLLQTSDGKTAIVDTTFGITSFEKHISVKTSQDPKTMTVYEHLASDHCVHMAFCFKDGNEMYFPFVSDKEVKLQKVEQKKCYHDDKRFLFKWGEMNGAFKSLESVAKPKTYLSITEEKLTIDTQRQCFFGLKVSGHRRRLKRRPGFIDIAEQVRNGRTGRVKQGSKIGTGWVKPGSQEPSTTAHSQGPGP
ncbi:uncharacterized protein LOC118776117 [Megalops cyprinoides]|uniref:uncharacterized protein LOC118776117 n=1 Tax=Megalops cyprinoides TaxID=118141 RepID=UPI0018643548|nr:uncharacterized protein LOC118776117 [Megalops cyprinoides]